MTNLDLLQKLTLGTDAVETVIIEGEEFSIRPLSSGELSKLQSMEKKGFVMKVGVNPQGKRQSVKTNSTDVDVNAGEFNENQMKAMYTAVAWGLSVNDEEIPVEVIQGLPAKIPEKLFMEITRITELSDNDLTLIKTFRREQ